VLNAGGEFQVVAKVEQRFLDLDSINAECLCRSIARNADVASRESMIKKV
jgi:hypothetical protein